MAVKLFIGGLSWSTDDTSLRAEFEKYGPVSDAVVIRERETGRSRGFGFVTYEEESCADAAISAMDNQNFEGRSIRVSKAQERQSEGRPFERRSNNDRPFERRSYGERSY